MEKWKVTITKEEIEDLFMLDETGFIKAMDKLSNDLVNSYQAYLIIKYLKDRGIL